MKFGLLHWTGAKTILLAAAVSLFSMTAYAAGTTADDGRVHPVAETKKAAKTVGHATKKTTKAVGHTTRKTTKAIGHGVRDGTRAIGHGTRKVTRDIGHAFRDGAREVTGKN